MSGAAEIALLHSLLRDIKMPEPSRESGLELPPQMPLQDPARSPRRGADMTVQKREATERSRLSGDGLQLLTNPGGSAVHRRRRRLPNPGKILPEVRNGLERKMFQLHLIRSLHLPPRPPPPLPPPHHRPPQKVTCPMEK